MRKITAALFLLMSVQIAVAQINVIPMPKSIKQLNGEGFLFNSKTKVSADAELTQQVKQIDEFFSPAMGFHLHNAQKNESENIIILKLDNNFKNLGDEGYRLKADSKTIAIYAYKPAGIFYGIETLSQLLPAEIFSKNKVHGVEWKVPAVEIEDCPRFSWRGSHLDVSRHFMPIKFVKKYIDLMAIHKLNRFHWHLTDHQGWRIEIKKYPKLTKIGAWRDKTQLSHSKDPNIVHENKRYGGFYTQKQIREIVKYAQERFIEVLPEIEMPGHCSAAIAAYPDLSCDGEKISVPYGWSRYKGKGGVRKVYCPGKEDVFKFNENVLQEVIGLFPYKYVHIGGDEVPKASWKECPLCRARIKTEGLKDVNELQSYFIKRIEKFLLANDRRLIGWDEIIQGGLAPEATMMCWRKDNYAAQATKEGHDVVITISKYYYFDSYQADPNTEPLAFGRRVPIDKVYNYNPIPTALTEEQARYIIGIQSCLWTEYVRTPQQAEYMMYPRACALAETAWSEPEKKNYDDFLIRLDKHLKRLDRYGVNYRPIKK